ncbi:MAG: choice-of-anchor Q domain-containing protein [Thermoleophilia bacterium]
MTLERVVVAANQSTSGGGGVLVNGGTLAISDSTVEGNTTSSVRGGGIEVRSMSGDVLVERTQLRTNTANGRGGGLSVFGGSSGALQLVDSVVSGNSATGRGGGMFLYLVPGNITIDGTAIESNTSSNRGGGAFFYKNAADVTIHDTTVADNAAGGSVFGGGLFFYKTAASHTVLISESTISGNTAQRGAGLFLYKGDATFVLENTTLAANQASSAGGALYDRGPFGSGATLRLTGVTIAGNSAATIGGGVLVDDLSTTIQNSIIADNTAPTSPDLGTGAANVALAYTALENPADATPASADHVLNVDPQLGSLSDNGGATETMAPAHDSPVVDAGQAFALTADPRGVPRPSDLADRANGDGSDGTDMGAVELQAPPTLVATSPASPGRSTSPRVTGTAPVGTATIRLYDNPACTGTPIGSGTAAELTGAGIQVTVQANATTQIHAVAVSSGGAVSACSGPFAYVEDSAAPASPASVVLAPASPANENSVRISGTAEAGSTVRVYGSSACSGTPLASGTAAEFASPGLVVAVTDDGTTTLYVTATDAAGNVSACAGPFAYVEDSRAPASPTLRSFTRVSAGSPRVRGTAEAGSTVRIYATRACSGTPLAIGTAEELAAGIPVPGARTPRAVYATATDAAGNVSSCAGPIAYAAPSASLVSDGLTVGADRRVTVVLRASPAGAKGTVQLALPRRGKRPTSLGARVRFTATRSGRVRVSLRLSPAAMQLLRAADPARLRLVVTIAGTVHVFTPPVEVSPPRGEASA